MTVEVMFNFEPADFSTDILLTHAKLESKRVTIDSAASNLLNAYVSWGVPEVISSKR